MGIVNLYLMWGAWKDLKVKKISDRYLWLGGIVGIASNLIDMITGEVIWRERFMAFLPGILFLIIAKITNEKIGYGDGWVILILGGFLRRGEIYAVLWLAVILSAVVSVGLLCIKKAGKEDRIPFLPFLWAAYIYQWGIRYV